MHLKRRFCCPARQRNLTAIGLHGRHGGLFWLEQEASKPGSVMTGKKDNKNWQIALRRNHKHFVSLIHGGFGSSAVGRLTFFVLKVAALEIVRRFSKSRCPCVWRGLQALQILCYPPFKWIQRWTPVKGLVKSMQVCIISLWAFHHKYIWITF